MPPLDSPEAMGEVAVPAIGCALTPKPGLLHEYRFCASRQPVSDAGLHGEFGISRPGKVSPAHSDVRVPMNP